MGMLFSYLLGDDSSDGHVIGSFYCSSLNKRVFSISET